VTADCEVPALQRGKHKIEDELVFTNHNGYVFHDSCGFEAGGKKEVEIVQDFIRRKSGERQLEDRLHALWFVPFGYLPLKFYTIGLSGTAFRWTVLGQWKI
jgi:hypothetical protein